MSERLARLNELENEVFTEYIAIRDGDEPEKIKTEQGEFDNLGWIESEVDYISDEKDRIEETTTLGGRTIDIRI